jgi:hypothetical protein
MSHARPWHETCSFSPYAPNPWENETTCPKEREENMRIMTTLQHTHSPFLLLAMGGLLIGCEMTGAESWEGNEVLDDELIDILEQSAEVDPTQNLVSCVTPPSTMVAWWPGDSNASDIKGSNHGTFYGSAYAGASGKVSGAFSLDGNGDYIQVPSSSSINMSTGDFSIDMWVKTTDSSGVKVLLDKRYENTSTYVQGYVVYLSGGQLGFQLADGGGSWYCSSDPVSSSCTNYGSGRFIADGQWHFIAITVDRNNTSGLKFYVDGSLVASKNPTIRNGSLTNSYPLRIGSRSSFVTGLIAATIDEIELFKRVLSAQEISSLYQAGSFGKCKSSSYCGDYSCNGSETCSTCPTDCGVCPLPCDRDGVCESGETPTNCPFDCCLYGPQPVGSEDGSESIVPICPV